MTTHLTDTQKQTRRGVGALYEYSSWDAMKRRVLKKDDKAYKNYGGRGIRIHPAWMDFRVFLADMGPRPEGATLDRIDNDGHYEPGNCRWATRFEQAQNQRQTIRTPFRGQDRTISEISELTGISRVNIESRYHRGERGEDLARKPRAQKIVFPDGRTTKEVAESLGITRGALLDRIRSGMSVEDAIRTARIPNGIERIRRSLNLGELGD